MAIYGRNTIGASWIECEARRRGRSITLTGTETALKISAYIRSVNTAVNGTRCALFNDTDDTLAYTSDVLAGFTDASGSWHDYVFTSSVAAGTYWLTIHGDFISGGGNTVQIAYDDVAANASLYESWFEGGTWPTPTADISGEESGDGNTQDISMYLETSSGVLVPNRLLLLGVG